MAVEATWRRDLRADVAAQVLLYIEIRIVVVIDLNVVVVAAVR